MCIFYTYLVTAKGTAMKKFIIYFILTIIIILLSMDVHEAFGTDIPKTIESEPEVANIVPEVVLRVGKDAYIDDVKRFAQKYSVSYLTMERVIDCENDTWDPERQSQVRYTEGQIARNPHWGVAGEREKSFGLVQIHIPAGNKWNGKTITEEMAKDPLFAIEFLAYKLSKGRGGMWSCY